ncbi:hypothetical protein AABC03_01200 [Staphylococcus nepalensis]
MKIKTKKQLNLPQLIEWGFKNDVTNTWYRASNVEEYISEVFFGATGLPQFSNTVDKNDLFTVEVEEEITEDTELNEIFLITNNSIYSERYYNYSINDVLSDNEGYYEELAMLIMQPEPIIIWTHEKGLVE